MKSFGISDKIYIFIFVKILFYIGKFPLGTSLVQ